MKLPFFGKPKVDPEAQAAAEREKRTRIRKRLGRIRKGEHLDRTREKGVDDLVHGLAKGDG